VLHQLICLQLVVEVVAQQTLVVEVVAVRSFIKPG
jgi:hypothetical protein